MRRIKQGLAFSLLGMLAAAALASFASAGCGSSNSVVGGDSGKTDAKGTTDSPSGSEGGKKDGGSDALPDISSPDAEAAAPTCLPTITAPTEQILSVNKAKLEGIQILGLTADKGYVIYMGFTASDGGVAQTLYAQPTAGGASKTILANVTASASYAYVPVAVDANTVFVWNNVTANGVGALSFWNTTTTTTTAVAGATDSAVLTAAASPDSLNLAFTTGVNTAGTLGNLVGATAAAPGTQSTLKANTGVSFTSKTFVPSMAFVNAGYVVASHQESGSGTITVSSWSTTGWGENDLVVGTAPYSTTVPVWDTDTAGDQIAAITAAGQLQVVPVIGAAGAINVGGATGTTQFLMAKSGLNVLSGTTAALSSTILPANVTVQPVAITGTGAFGGLWTPFGALGASPDGTEILYYSTEDTTTDAVDLYLAANAAASTPTPIVTSKEGAVFGDVFTADSKYVIFVNELSAAGGAVQGSIGQLNVWDIANSKLIAVSGGMHSDWDSNALATGSMVLYNDNFLTGSSTATEGIADLKTVDVSATTLTPTVIQAEADQNYFLSTDKAAIVYSITLACDTDAAGIYFHTF
jgi:hypothetical protein